MGASKLEKDNERLSKITFITSVGDFISFFSILIFLYKSTGSLVVASSAVLAEALGKMTSYFTFPSLLNKFSPKGIIVFSQFSSAFLILILLSFVTGWVEVSSFWVLLVYFALVLCSQYFDAARETFSKVINEKEGQLRAQSQLLSQFFSAQFIGPILSFVLIKNFSLHLPLLVDALSFFFAGFISLRLSDFKIAEEKRQLFSLKPLSYIWKKKELLDVFIVRTLGTKVYIAIFNVVVFSVVVDHLKIDLINSVWIYSLIGLGSMFPSKIIASKRVSSALSNLNNSEAYLACIGLMLLIVSRIGFVNVPALTIAGVLIFVGGISNGLVAVTTRSIRRKVTTNEEFAEVVSLENMLGFFLQILIKPLCLFLMARGILDYKSGVYLCCLGIFSTMCFIYFRLIDRKEGIVLKEIQNTK